MRSRLLAILVAANATVSLAAAQEQNSEVIQVSPDMFLRWYGHAGRTYFVQISDPNDHLRKWIWAPIIETGNDEDISYEVDGTADKGFFRLWFTDEPTADPDGGDFDGDGLSNLAEVLTHQTNPLKSDTDGDGLLDGWEIANSLDPNDDGSTNVNNGGSGDPDNDGLTNSEEQDLGADPNDADSDDDGITDGGENDQGTDPNDSEDTPDAEWFILTGDLDQDEVKTRKRTVTIPAGQSRVIAVLVVSDEYDYYTDPETANDFNDTLEWDIQPSQGDELQGSIDVNARDTQWDEAAAEGRTAQGFSPVHLETGMTATAPDDAALTVEIELSATNIGDGAKPSTVMVALLPVDIAVDANRNGEVEFGTDQTSSDKPYRFWVNNDQDDVEADEPSVVETPDHADAQIATKRDLEDFARIRLSVGLPINQLKGGDWKVGLRFKDGGGQPPAIRIWPNESATGEDSYLDQHPAAERQIEKQSFGATNGGTVFIPTSYWQDRDDTEAHLIFEGISKGTGELALILKNGSEGPEIEGPVVELKLLDVREMFQRARIVNAADEIPNPWIDDTPPAQSWVWDPWNWAYDEDPEAEETTAIFVHGWRLTYYEYLNWAQTSYKRLWHQGFKGKFYTFRWATLSGDQSSFEGYLTYNPSEYRSWLCGPALASWVNGLPNAGRRSLFAHSMGNVISGSALRNGMSVQRYALCNAAMASMAYDSGAHMKLDPDTGQPWDEIWGDLGHQKTPDTDSEAAIRDSFGLEGKFSGGNNFPQMINFYLRDDEALRAWVNNNRFFKPDSTGHSYYYQHIPQPPNISYKLFQAPPVGNPREVTSPPEAFGYVTKALTRTAGSDSRTGGSIGSSVNMNDWGVGANHSGFGETHSAQWRWSNQSTSHFWEQLCEKLQLTQQE